jgi:hypothetical protein
MTLRADNWMQFYENLECNKEVNQQMALIMGFTRFQANNADCISNLEKSPGLSILAVNGFNELFLFHAVPYQGQNLFYNDPKLLGLSGGGSMEDCYRLDPTTLFQDVEFQTPSWRDLKGARTLEGVNTWQAGDQNPSSFKGKLGIVAPPLVLTSILVVDTMDPAHLIPVLSGKLQEFDWSSPTVKACTLL